MRILLTGKNGQLGWELHRFLEQDFEVIATDRHELDFTSPYGLQDRLQRLPEIDLIINAAAYTDVDRAEHEYRIADFINVEAPEILAMEAEYRDIPLIHFSSDYVFDGKKWTQGYTENDEPLPLNAYGRGKLLGEYRVRDYCEKHLIFRLAGLYGIRRKNFFTTVLRAVHENRSLRVVDDQVISPNWCPLVAEAIRHAVNRLSNGFQEWGTYHLSGSGSTNWYEFARLIYTHAAEVWDMPRNSPVAVHSEGYGAEAVRPSFSVLISRRFEKTFDYSLPDWKTQFLYCINSIKQ